MNRLKATNSVPFANRDTAPGTGTPQYATNGDPATSTPQTIWPAYAWNMIQDEIMNVILTAGLTPDDTDWTQLLQAIRAINFPTGLGTLTSTTTLTNADVGNFYNVNGSSLTITLEASTFTAGQTIGFLAAQACTIATSSSSFYGGGLSGSSIDMPAESFVVLQWDGTAWRQLAGSFLIAPSSLASSGWKKYPDSTSPTGYFIEQWGTTELTYFPQSVAFPIAFPHALLNVIVCEGHASGLWGSETPTIYGVDLATSTASVAVIYGMIWDSPNWTGDISSGITCSWRAKGY